MTSDHAIALSLVSGLSRVHLADRLRADDPVLVEQAGRLLASASLTQTRAASLGVSVVAWNDPRYPASLLTLPDFPPALWFRGRLEALDAPCVAIVGSRTATAVALEIAALLGEGLASRGLTVVSGLARGVDSAAHRGALVAGTTTAVLGSGPDIVYPPEHKSLAEEIVRTGLVVSEYPPGAAPIAFHFPQRNRLISGVSLGVVVVEAATGSGSLITAECALEQGREVMAVPGNPLSGRNRGVHALIRDGAKIVEDVDDILNGLGSAWGTERVAQPDATNCSGKTFGHPVLQIMEKGHPYDLDTLRTATGLESARLLPVLIDLELRQLVVRVGGGRFMRSV